MKLVYLNGMLLEKQPNWKEYCPFLAEMRSTAPTYLFWHDRSGHFPNELGIKTLHQIPKPRKRRQDFGGLLQTLVDAFIVRTLESNRRVYVAYSGGIDSTAVMCAILRSDHLARLQREKALLVGMTGRSIDENPEFFYRSVSKNCQISLLDFSKIGDPSVVFTGGEFGDLLVASLMIEYLQGVYEDSEQHLLSWRDGLAGFIKSGSFQPASVDRFLSFAETAPFEPRTALQFWWWLDFCTKWQENYFRAYRWCRNDLTENQLKNSIYYPFESEEFQIWAMNHMGELETPKEYRRVKYPLLDFIYQFNRDRHYYDHKVKYRSQRHIGKFVYKNAVWENFSSVWDINTNLGLFT